MYAGRVDGLRLIEQNKQVNVMRMQFTDHLLHSSSHVCTHMPMEETGEPLIALTNRVLEDRAHNVPAGGGCRVTCVGGGG